jgi:hypothetical protein
MKYPGLLQLLEEGITAVDPTLGSKFHQLREAAPNKGARVPSELIDNHRQAIEHLYIVLGMVMNRSVDEALVDLT